VERPEMGRKRKFWKVKEEFLGGSKKYLQKADMFTRFYWSFHLCSNVKFDFAAYIGNSSHPVKTYLQSWSLSCSPDTDTTVLKKVTVSKLQRTVLRNSVSDL
jgi:hypothetical protein